MWRIKTYNWEIKLFYFRFELFFLCALSGCSFNQKHIVCDLQTEYLVYITVMIFLS